MKKTLSIIVFWGAVWGIIEATFGYILHVASFGVGGAILFPIGFYLMKKAKVESDNLKAIFLTSVVASLIKLVDLTLPYKTIFKVINPAVSILFEGLIVFAVFYVIQNKENFSKYKLVQSLALGLGWRSLYAVYLLFLPANIIKVSPIGSFSSFVTFFAVDGLINSAIIYTYLKLSEIKPMKNIPLKIKSNPVIACLTLAVAIFIQYRV